MGWRKNSLRNPRPIFWDVIVTWRSLSLNAKSKERTIIAIEAGAEWVLIWRREGI
jgi:hypothetical protein